ncbi:MAG: cation:proton antiporter, partial [Thermomicrobiales bacterium]|nr:cation:proton antiporter [Thermomicrobiales bacterium]
AVGWSIPAALLLGGAFAISSSVVALKLLLGRGEGDSAQGRIALGVGIVQDLCLVPMLAVVPVLANEGGDVRGQLLQSLAMAAFALLAVVPAGLWIVPRLLDAVARHGARELFLLLVVLIALGAGLAADAAGLSFALGAFLAGIVVSESEFDGQVLADIVPFRDLFASLFFVAVGMLLDPGYVAAHFQPALVLVAALVFGKLLIVGGAQLAAGVDPRTAALVAALLAQMGEFSFVLAGVGMADGVIDQHQYEMILAAALGSILLAPGVLAAAPALVRIAHRLPGVVWSERTQVGLEPVETPVGDHAVICGYGRIGTQLAIALEERGLSYSAIDLNPAVIRTLRQRGVRAIYGDAGAEPVLERAGVRSARVLALAMPDLVAARAAARAARRLQPEIHVIARANAGTEMILLSRAGADEVVQPEFEASLEFAFRVLRWFDVPEHEAQATIERQRMDFYGIAEETAPVLVQPIPAEG